MFEFLFKYPANAFQRGQVVLLGSWPKWLLFAVMLAACLGLAALMLRGTDWRVPAKRIRALVLWGLQSAMVALLLLLLWQPALSVTALKAQQNIVAIILDDSKSMSLRDGSSSTRLDQARQVLRSGLLNDLSRRFQVRIYHLGADLERTPDVNKLAADQPSTQIGKGLGQLAAVAGTLPVGAAILLSDGADGGGGVDAEVMNQLRRRRLPVSTIGFGEIRLTHDVELDTLAIPARTLPDSRLEAQIKLRQEGFAGKHTRLTLSSAGKVLATRDIVLRDVPEQSESMEFHAGTAGVRTIEAQLASLDGETNRDNNRRSQIISVEPAIRRILYVEGEPRWDYKFLRRAVDDDHAVAVVSILRTTQNKIYRQGIGSPSELADGFPSKPEDLFNYDGLVIGSVESSFFTTAQQQMIEAFADRRGGGVLFLGGRFGLADGGYNVPPFNSMLPVNLPNRRITFQRSFVAAELTDAGRNSLLCRIEDTREKSSDHWEILPYLANFQDPGTAKPGATVLARVNNGGTRLPLLITENYGHGRTAVFATGGSWRWRMQQPVSDHSEETFWRQLLRWTVTGSPGRITLSTANETLNDDGHITLKAEVRDRAYQPASDADVAVHLIKPDGSAESISLRADPNAVGRYTADWNAASPGSYAAEAIATRGSETLGRDVLPFRREDGVAENFRREQNRDLLQQLSNETGGRYYSPSDAKRLPDEIAYSEAGITGREFRDLWNMPVVFLLLLLLKSSEWILRRRWGAV